MPLGAEYSFEENLIKEFDWGVAQISVVPLEVHIWKTPDGWQAWCGLRDPLLQPQEQHLNLLRLWLPSPVQDHRRRAL